MGILHIGQKEQGHSLKRIPYANAVGISSQVSVELCYAGNADVARIIKLSWTGIPAIKKDISMKDI